MVGGPDLVHNLIESPGLGHVSFTGTAQAGAEVAAAAGKRLLSIAAEVGGGVVGVVHRSADLSRATLLTAFSAMAAAGQSCSATYAVFVEEVVLEEFVQHLRTAVRQMKVGTPQRASTLVGPLINVNALERAESAIRAAVARGAKLLEGGFLPASRRTGHHLSPTLLLWSDTITPPSQPYAPVLRVIPIRQVGSIPWPDGLLGVSWWAAEHVSFGTDARSVWLNDAPAFDPRLPFGNPRTPGEELGREAFLRASSTQAVWSEQTSVPSTDEENPPS
ncbi:aldehyde dehydrogenase family protein [Streptosporangium amethystogenes]|uniref:aldehyde dehydrogenase family protein n=1 Tax=Streptosporangium amethystogenes TaxID=2002 RepID=UPI003CCBB396